MLEASGTEVGDVATIEGKVALVTMTYPGEMSELEIVLKDWRGFHGWFEDVSEAPMFARQKNGAWCARVVLSRWEGLLPLQLGWCPKVGNVSEGHLAIIAHRGFVVLHRSDWRSCGLVADRTVLVDVEEVAE